jgi:hypothetical protein
VQDAAEAPRDLIETVLKPWCRAYARLLGDRPADGVYELLCSLVFRAELGYWPQFREPRSFFEKIWHRGLYDRDPCWTMLSDKLRMRAYIEALVGREHLVPLLWSGADPEAIPFDELPTRFVLKTNHGSAFNLLVPDKRRLDRAAAIAQLRSWLSVNYCEDRVAGMEWGYKHIQPRVMIEEFIGSDDAGAPDYKFYCYSGRTEFIQIDTARGQPEHRRTYHDRDLNPLPTWLGKPHHEQPPPRPPNLDGMMRIADILAGDYPHLRVDLYSIDGRIYVAELTCYTAGGIVPYHPRRFDFLFGEKWELREHRCPQMALRDA